jgi:hypothetical protein
MKTEPLTTLRSLALVLPDAREVEAWGAPTFRVKTIFATYSDGSQYKPHRPSTWIKAAPVDQALLVQRAPDRFFVPPYVGAKGWVGVLLDTPDLDWDELKDLLWDAWKMSAPKTLVAKYPGPPPGWQNFP